MQWAFLFSVFVFVSVVFCEITYMKYSTYG